MHKSSSFHNRTNPSKFSHFVTYEFIEDDSSARMSKKKSWPPWKKNIYIRNWIRREEKIKSQKYFLDEEKNWFSSVFCGVWMISPGHTLQRTPWSNSFPFARNSSPAFRHRVSLFSLLFHLLFESLFFCLWKYFHRKSSFKIH